MQLSSTENREILIGGGKQMMFGIDSDTSIIFDILRNKMYSNKIGAVAREVASNSRDANRESGTDQPVEIEFTDNSIWMAGNLSLIFRDNGIGISPDRMENIFMKYAASTKRDSNTQTGGFGLGAKTPFAYTDSFIVHTVNDNIEYVYNAIIDATGKGKMVLVYEDFTDKQSGTEIIIPIVSHDDRTRFESEIYKATMYWDNVKYVNFRQAKPNVVYVQQGDNFRMTKYNGWANFVGLLDGIPYEIKPEGKDAAAGYTIMLDLEVGEVTINANRETLQYDERTVSYINSKYDAFEKELEAQVQSYLSDNATYKDAYLKFTRFRRSGASRTGFEQLIYDLKENSELNIDFDIKFDNEVIKYIKFKYHTIQEVKWDSWLNKSSYSDSPLDVTKKLVYFDKGRLSVAKNEELEEFLFIKPIKGNPESVLQEEINKLNELTDGQYLKYSEVKVESEAAAGTREKRDFVTLKVRTENKYSEEIFFDKKAKKLRDIDNAIFIPVESISRNLYVDSNETLIVKYLFNKPRIYFINRTSFETHLAPNGYKTLKQMWGEVDLSLFSDIAEAEQIKQALGEVNSVILEHFPQILPKSFLDLKEKTLKIPEELGKVWWYRMNIPKSKFNYQGLVEKYHTTMERDYPMLLPYLRHGSGNTESKLKVIKNYINEK